MICILFYTKQMYWIQFWAINIFLQLEIPLNFQMLPFNDQGFALPSHEAVVLVGSLLIWRIYLFILAKSEAVVCSGYVFLECHLLADTNKKEKQWSTESTLWCLLWCFFLQIVLKSGLGTLNVPTQTAGSSEAEKLLCLCRVVALVCSKALDPCTGLYILPVKITKSL